MRLTLLLVGGLGFGCTVTPTDRPVAETALSAAPSMWWAASSVGDETSLVNASVTIELAVDAAPPKDAAPPRDAAPPKDAAPPPDAPPPIDAGPPPDALLTRDAARRR